MIYLASPYSHENPDIMRDRHDDAALTAGALMARGEVVFCPVAHGATIARVVFDYGRQPLPEDWPFWRAQCLPLVERASALWVLQLDGWMQSEGVRAEIVHAHAHRVPVRFCDPVFGLDREAPAWLLDAVSAEPERELVAPEAC